MGLCCEHPILLQAIWVDMATFLESNKMYYILWFLRENTCCCFPLIPPAVLSPEGPNSKRHLTRPLFLTHREISSFVQRTIILALCSTSRSKEHAAHSCTRTPGKAGQVAACKMNLLSRTCPPGFKINRKPPALPYTNPVMMGSKMYFSLFWTTAVEFYFIFFKKALWSDKYF